MRIMSTRTTEYMDAIDHLPGGAILVFHDVGWDDYEQLLEDLTQRPGLRVSYDQGRLEIVSPLSKHERYTFLIERLLCFVSDELGLTVEGYGITTWKRKRLLKGAEADACFYLANAARVITKVDIDLESDPPPDIVVEIDITNESRSKFPIYAALRVPEIWQYDGKSVRFFSLNGNEYGETLASRFIPVLKPEMLASALDQCKREGQTAALRTFAKEFRSARG